MKYVYPTMFCAFPALWYWELDGKPVSERVANESGRAIQKPTEVAKNIKYHMGYFIEVS